MARIENGEKPVSALPDGLGHSKDPLIYSKLQKDANAVKKPAQPLQDESC
jgi:hypothetical protein